MLLAGYTFLYLPIAVVVLFSFNASPVPGMWTGFSTHWYTALRHNDDLISAVLTSAHIAAWAATGATLLGTLAALALVRLRAVRGLSVLRIFVAAPLMVPEVMTGLSLLLMFVSFERLIGWPSERGMMTVVLAHITLAMGYVFLIVKARLQTFDHSLEEAALDLGARPYQVLWHVTLPLIAPSLIAGWLLSFSLSLDDVVVASFVSGPGSTTLPMLIFSSLRVGATPEINALATVLVVMMSMSVACMGWVIWKRNPANRDRISDVGGQKIHSAPAD